MKKYAVAVCNLFENTNKVVIVEAATDIDACIKAVGDDPAAFLEFETVEDVVSYYYNGELSVSKPVEI